jgi:hypothetical protein
MMSRFVAQPLLLAALGGSVLILAAAPAAAQARKPKPDSPSNLKQLDDKATELEQQYVTGLLDLARGYEDAGQTEKAKAVLRDLLKVKPDADAVKSKLAELDELVFDEHAQMVEIDVTRGWTTTGLFVKKDQPIRFTSSGNYRMILNEEVGPGGLSTDDLMRDMAAGVPSGAVMGLIAPPPRPGQRQPPELGAPFTVGASREYTPNEDGALLLRVNLPPGTKSVGKVRVLVSGNIRKSP